MKKKSVNVLMKICFWITLEIFGSILEGCHTHEEAKIIFNAFISIDRNFQQVCSVKSRKMEIERP